MSNYFFILGRDPALSVAEIISVLNRLSVKHSLKYFSQEALIVETETDLSKMSLMNVLGGTVKFGKVISEVGLDESEKKFEEVISAKSLRKNFLPEYPGKLHTGISIYDAGGEKLLLSSLTDQLKDLNVVVKKNLQADGLKIGFVQIKDRYLSSVSVEKNELLKKGAEIVFLVSKDKILIGKTLEVQKFAEFTFRDMARPEKDKRSGIMPPKLARMMINLSETASVGVLLDPFCGSGTILQEAVTMGYRQIHGTDISQKAVSDSQKNIHWLLGHIHNAERSSYNIKIGEADARRLSEKFSRNSVDAIVTEPYLGPAFFEKPKFLTVNRLLPELGSLYLAAFGSFGKILQKDGKVVIIFPAFNVEGKWQFMDILPQIQRNGFIQKDLLSSVVQTAYPAYQKDRRSVVYGGKEQFVRREILVFQKI